MSVEVMRNLAREIRRENRGVSLVAPEAVNRDREVDITPILQSGLGNERDLMDNGEIVRHNFER